MEAEEIEEIGAPTPVDALKDKGVAAGDVQKLKDAGFRTVESIAYTPKKTLIQIKGLSENKVEKIIMAASELVENGFKSAKIFFEQRKQIIRITTGSK